MIIATATHCSWLLVQGESMLTHCSDGWDRTPQICATIQLIMDPYHRTLEGFAVMVEKEWVSFGHKFKSRGAIKRSAYQPPKPPKHKTDGPQEPGSPTFDWEEDVGAAFAAAKASKEGGAGDGDRDTEEEQEGEGGKNGEGQGVEASDLTVAGGVALLPPPPSPSVLLAPPVFDQSAENFSPVFVQWLDAVHQIHRQLPWAFEFDISLLQYLVNHCGSCLHGNFLYDTEKEAAEAGVTHRTRSIWGDVFDELAHTQRQAAVAAEDGVAGVGGGRTCTCSSRFVNHRYNAQRSWAQTRGVVASGALHGGSGSRRSHPSPPGSPASSRRRSLGTTPATVTPLPVRADVRQLTPWIELMRRWDPAGEAACRRLDDQHQCRGADSGSNDQEDGGDDDDDDDDDDI
jgi:hypothetical protein